MMPLEERIRRGREAIAKALAVGADVRGWIEHLQHLEDELALQAEAIEITRLMETQGWTLVWSDVLNEEIAFAKDEATASKVPGGIVTYTRDEIEAVLGRSPDMLRLAHEGKRLGAKLKKMSEELRRPTDAI